MAKVFTLSTGEEIDIDDPPESVRVDLGNITATQETQVRAAMREATIKEYQGLAEDGSDPPPGWAVRAGDHLYLADAFHRHEALKRAQKPTQRLYVVVGTKMDAFKLGLFINKHNPLALTYADRQSAAFRILDDEPTLTSRPLAEIVGVSNSTANIYRAAWEAQRGIVTSTREFQMRGHTKQLTLPGAGGRDEMLDSSTAADYTPPSSPLPPTTPLSNNGNGNGHSNGQRPSGQRPSVPAAQVAHPDDLYRNDQGYIVAEPPDDGDADDSLFANIERAAGQALVIAPDETPLADTPAALECSVKWDEDGAPVRVHAYVPSDAVRAAIWRDMTNQGLL